jgi:DNA-binding NarL/FixJ family response regulator
MRRADDHHDIPLTELHLDVLRLLATGATDAAIAAAIHTSERTVRRRLKDIGLLLDRSSRTAIVVEALRRGLLSARLADPRETIRP